MFDMKNLTRPKKLDENAADTRQSDLTPEQTFVDAALRGWRSNMDRAGKLFGSLTSDELELQVVPSRNRLIYIWGHLSASNDAILPLFGFGLRRFPDLESMFAGATRISGPLIL